jgi:D-serine/D-alanine/glycine transporter
MVTTVSAVCFMFVWTIFLLSYVVYRRKRREEAARSTFRMPGGVVMVYVVLAFFVFILWALTTQPDTLTALLVTPIWFAVLCGAWLFVRRSTNHLARHAAHIAYLRDDSAAADETDTA